MVQCARELEFKVLKNQNVSAQDSKENENAEAKAESVFALL